MASNVLPDPDTPATATVRHSGTSASTSPRLSCRAAHADDRGQGSPAPEYHQPPGPGRSRYLPAPGGFCSGVDRCAGPAVQAQRLHDGERGGPGEDLDVRGGQYAGVLGDDGRSRTLGDFVEVALNPSPGVLPVLHEVGHRVDRGQRLLRAGFDVGDVLLVHRDVLAGGEPAEVPADEVGPRVVQRDGRGAHVPGDVLGQVEVVDRHPAGVDHVDEHQGVVAGEVDIDVVRRVVGAVPGQLDALASYLQGVAISEGHLRRGPGRAVVAQ